MKQLLVLLAGDERGSAVLRDGNAPASVYEDVRWSDLPRAERVIAIVPAARMRTLVVALPPTAPEKRVSVVRYALEDQLADDIDAQHVVIAGIRGGRAIVHVLDRTWLMAMVAALRTAGKRPDAVLAESDLVPPADADALTWVWRDDGGFVVAPDGGVGILDRSAETLPSGLLLSLRRADAGAATHVVVHGPAALANEFAAWTAATGVPFALAPSWDWRDFDSTALLRATNVLTADLETGPRTAGTDPATRWLRRAAGWGTAALALHVGATFADWATMRVAVDRVEREVRQSIDEALPDAQGDKAAWRRAFAAARHAQGRPAPDDLLPLLADTASALGALSPGAVRVINYEAGQLTLDLDKAAAPAIAGAYQQWTARGIVALQADTAGALRARLTRE